MPPSKGLFKGYTLCNSYDSCFVFLPQEVWGLLKEVIVLASRGFVIVAMVDMLNLWFKVAFKAPFEGLLVPFVIILQIALKGVVVVIDAMVDLLNMWFKMAFEALFEGLLIPLVTRL